MSCTDLLLELGLGGLGFLQAGLQLGDLSAHGVHLLLGLAGLVDGRLAVHLLLLQVFFQSAHLVLNATFLLCQRIAED